MSAVRLYGAQIGCAIRLSLASRADFAAQVGGMLVNNVFVLLMWFLFFAGFRSVGGWRLADVALLMGLVMVVVGGANVFAGGYRDLAARILRGEIDALLTQPRPVLPRLLAAESVPHGWGDMGMGAVLLLAAAQLGARDLPLLALALLCGFTVFLSCGVMFAALAFWMHGARSLARDLVDFVVLFSVYPGSIWTGGLKFVAYSLLPAGFIVLLPVQLLRHPSLEDAALLAGATLAYALAAAWTFRRGLARYRRGDTA